jgi:2-hydroxychromene-2-carboxylate isomerase
MASPIEFYFDFSSPYSYLASETIEPLAARYGRRVEYKPVLLGAAFKVTGLRPLAEVPLKGEYCLRDFARSARFSGVPFTMPQPFPIGAVGAARIVLWLSESDRERADAFVHAAFRAYFAHGRNILEPAVLGELLHQIGVDSGQALQAIQQPALKERLKEQVDSAVARGVFGAPFIFVDGEPFWGQDRLPQIERWLATGPF